MVIPSNQGIETGSIPIHILTTGAYTLGHVDITIDGKSSRSTIDSAGAGLLDANLLQPGSHLISGNVQLDGGIFVPMNEICLNTIPQVAVVPFGQNDKLIIPSSDNHVNLTARIASNILPISISYLIDGIEVAKTNRSPYEIAVWDASAVKIGKHNLQIDVTAQSGIHCLSLAYSFVLQHRIEHVVAISNSSQSFDNDGAKRKTPVIPFDYGYLRYQARRMTQRSPQMRTGNIGHINGLDVTTLSRGNEILYERGGISPIDGSVRNGTGKTNTIANAAEDTLLSVEEAAEYCKDKTTNLLDWRTTDITVSFKNDGVKISGTSAGCACATAIMSAALRKPIDNSVAITGAISIQGKVQPVGAVKLKVYAAFTDPAIQTVIVPESLSSVDDLIELYVIHPDLFDGKRIILVTNMDQVLRYTLIGYDVKYDQSEQYIRHAVQLFGDEKDYEAIMELSRASKITPENSVIYIWLAFIQKAMSAPKAVLQIQVK